MSKYHIVLCQAVHNPSHVRGHHELKKFSARGKVATGMLVLIVITTICGVEQIFAGYPQLNDSSQMQCPASTRSIVDLMPLETRNFTKSGVTEPVEIRNVSDLQFGFTPPQWPLYFGERLEVLKFNYSKDATGKIVLGDNSV